MTIEDRLKGFIVANYGNIKNFADHTDIPYQTIVSIFRRGIKNSSFSNIQNMCNVLGISIDELGKGNLNPGDIVIPPHKKRDLATVMREYTYMYHHEGTFILDKEPLTDEEFNMFIDQFAVVIELIRKRRLKENLKESNLK